MLLLIFQGDIKFFFPAYPPEKKRGCEDTSRSG